MAIKLKQNKRNRQLLECLASKKATTEKLIQVRQFLQQGADVNATDAEGKTSLHLAVSSRKPIIVKLLLKRGANVNAQDFGKSTPLHEAVLYKDTRIVGLLLNEGADVNVRKTDGYTPLHIASSTKATSVVKLLLAAGAEVNAQTEDTYTPLHIGARYRDTSIVKLLLKNDADVNAKTNDGWTPLHAAALSGAAFVVKLLLDNGAEVNVQSYYGDTPLHDAARAGATSVVELLLNRGADVDMVTEDGNTPMHEAAYFGFTSVMELLLNKGYKVNSQTKDKYTELHSAARSKNKSAVKLLLDSGSEVNVKTTYGYTPLHIASLSGVASVVELLLCNGADADLNARLQNGDTVLHEAVRSGVTPVVEMLLKRSADVNALTEASYTPLHEAAFKGETDIAKLLLKYGAHINAYARDNITPLHQAVVWEKTSLVKLLLDEGAQVNIHTKYGYTPLHMAARSAQVAIMEILLHKGADVNAQSLDGITPLHESVRSEKTCITELLINKGADVNAKIKSGYTPLHGAARFGLTSIVELLLNKGADVNSLTINKSTPLLEAARSENVSVVKLLLKRGANINCHDIYGNTPLHGAVSYKAKPNVVYRKNTDAGRNTSQQEVAHCENLSIAEFLLNNGAEVNAQIINGYTPLHEAATFESSFIVSLLLKRGANINALAKNKVSPLHQAVISGDISKVELLLNKGADVNAQKTDGDTPLHLALRKEDAAIATLLVHRGANVLLRNNTKDTPLCYSSLFSFSDNTNIVSLLQNAENEAKENLQFSSHNTHMLQISNEEDININKDLNLNTSFKYLKSKDISGVAGQLYEIKMISLILLRMLNHEQIEHDIYLGANIDGIGAMDDICLRYRVRGRLKPVVLFIQVKHRDDPNKGKLTNEALWIDGDFSLRKYFKSYLMIKERFCVINEDPIFEGKFDDVDCYFILYTSAKECIAKKKTENKINYSVHELLNTGKNTQIFQYSHDEVDIDRLTEITTETSIENLGADNFFRRLWFYTGQAKQDEVESILCNEISKHYNNEINEKHSKFMSHSNAILLKALHEIQKWWMQKYVAEYLCRSDDFFRDAKIACLDDVFKTVSLGMKTLGISLNLDFKQNSSISNKNGTVKSVNTILARLHEMFHSKIESTALGNNVENYIVNLLLTNESENYSQSIDQLLCANLNRKTEIADDHTNNMIHSNIMYLKRAGTSGLGGSLSRIKMLCLIFLRMRENNDLEKDFQLGSKIRGISFFNDICLRYQSKGEHKPVVLFLQLVHREDIEKGQLTVENMRNGSGNFSLRKYYKSYLECKKQFVASKDPMFEGKFQDIDSYFILSTSAKGNFAKIKTESQMNKVLQDLIQTKQDAEPFQYDHDETDIDCLTKMTIMDQIKKLGLVFYKLMVSKKYKPDIITTDKLIAKYHVAMSREVFEPCDTQSSKEYRTWKFRDEFFDSDDEYLVTLQTTLYEILSSKRLGPGKPNECQPNNTIRDHQKLLKSLKIELPLSFGNLDMTFRKSKNKVSERMKTLTDSLMHLMKMYEDTKIVEINDDDVGPEKILKQCIFDIKGGVGGAVGNLLVADAIGMLKFDLQNENLPQNAALFLKELKDDRHNPFNKLIGTYRFKINIRDFPILTFNEDGYNKKQARDFLSRFWLCTNQAKEDEVEQILRDEMNKKYSKSKIDYNHECRSTSDLIALHYLNEIQKWWMQTNESPYLSRASELFERAELADIYNLLQTVINYMYISNIDRLDLKVKRIDKDNTTDQMRQMFKKIFVQLFNMFDPQFKGSFDLKLQYSIFNLMNFRLQSAFFAALVTSELSLRIHPEMEWVALILVVCCDETHRYRVVAKAGPDSSSGCYRAKDGFMIREQIFDGQYCTTRDCLENVYVNDHELYALPIMPKSVRDEEG